MQIERVDAVAFGPFVEERLELAPGLNVIVGPNEAGKSTWHAAIYAGLCGMRRARGQPRREDREFADRHRPWSGSRWFVRATVRLDDDRRFDLVQDLAGGVDCRATDELGRDVSSEIISEGSPDGARWLGLDRNSFGATACVRQGEMLRVIEDAGELQAYLQRATTTTAADATAAGALERLRAFRSVRVGTLRSNSMGPHANARRKLEVANNALLAATAAHQDFEHAAERAERLLVESGQKTDLVRLLEAAQMMRDADGARRHLERIEELVTRYPEEPAPASEDLELANEVAGALDEWARRPLVPKLSATTVAEVQALLDSLPDEPSGDRVSHPTVDDARTRYVADEQLLAAHDGLRPSEPVVPVTGGLSHDDLLSVASELSRAFVISGSTIALGPRAIARAIAVAGIALAVAGVALVATGDHVAGIAAAVVGLILALVGLVRSRRAVPGNRAPADREAERRAEEARSRVEAASLPADPDELRHIAESVVLAERDQERVEQWVNRRRALEERATGSRRLLADALRARGVEVENDSEIESGDQHYLAMCRENAEVASRAARRPELLARLDATRGDEQAVEFAEQARAGAERRLLSVAAVCGVLVGTPEVLAHGLREWQGRRSEEQLATRRAHMEWGELQSLLGARTLDDLRSEVRAVASSAADRASGFDALMVRQQRALVTLDDDLALARQESDEASRRASEANGELREKAQALPSVPEAAERQTQSAAELDDIERLDSILERTIDFLATAQDRVHREIAPILNASVGARLALVTAGRYRDVAVDPQSLAVRVPLPNGTLQEARLLSQGTAEQIYLLLRVAMAERLGHGETCPLILDDPTVNADSVRTIAILEILRELAKDRQVVLFTQEDHVRDWALGALGERDRLTELASPPIGVEPVLGVEPVGGSRADAFVGQER